MKLLLLFLLVLFGAYSEHQAEKTVKKIRANEKRLMRYKNEIKAEDMHFIKRTVDLSYVAGHGYPFGSVVVKDGKIVGEGWNKTYPLNDPSAHAVVEAIRDACKTLSSKDLAGCSLYTSSQPCPMCLSLIYLTGVEKIFYIPGEITDPLNAGSDIEHIYHELAKPQLERAIPEIPISTEATEKTQSMIE